ncbi:hypothetical protein C1645_741230 [Glomus cerebriforme]|uniref:Uncharacterized protein n=1 Tax=Glomus cerebriforme TaxID=658196 RepID=A0A397SPP7_9GLOM|nr:hypothetical protein C1645_741230 [Glomus cerebriforme]
MIYTMIANLSLLLEVLQDMVSSMAENFKYVKCSNMDLIINYESGLSVFGLILESRNRFFELFSPEWEGKMVLLTFRLIREVGFLDFISDMEVSSQNLHLMHLLKESLVKMDQIFFRFQLENLNVSFIMKFHFFLFFSLRNVLTECFFFFCRFSSENSGLETFSSENRNENVCF